MRWYRIKRFRQWLWMAWLCRIRRKHSFRWKGLAGICDRCGMHAVAVHRSEARK